MKNRLINKIFETPIGKVICGLDSSELNIKSIATNSFENGQSETFEIFGYNIELVEFKIRQPLYNGDNVTDSQGWIWRIEKNEDSETTLTLSCKLTDFNNSIDFDVATGEHLDAIEATNSHWTLHIGTEDGEIMNYRAELNDWFPTRLQNKVDSYQSITQMLKNGFETKIPQLKVGEKLHIQFITAYDKRNSESINTWLAVDEFKSKLENWIGIF
ncbi:MAG: hypothetical protein H6587_05275 [Flavobacteriales bacterium]|nr:hypothetical protein [Flavobacteriales bacterium]MCB9363961.1 hypothetical protein [Flavobacteriales bacterium]